MGRALALFLALIAATAAGSAGAGVTPLARAHAHNDYLHARPLLDALDQGFTSVEADIWLVNGMLLVAHEPRGVRPDRTLRTLYLDPLRRIVAEREGRVYPGSSPPLQLLVDIKSDGEATYRTLHEELREYEAMLTVARGGQIRAGAVQVVISGNRPRELMLGQTTRYAGFDGRLADLRTETPRGFMPLVSDNWMLHFRWMGSGPMPDDERAKLRRIVAAAHARGRRLRFWATPDGAGPDREALWTELLRAGVDYITTDDLAGLGRFLRRADPTPSTPR